jgi:methylthioribose-1-phosphate isomerase
VNTAPKIVHIAYEPGVLRIIDQTKLPETVDVLSLTAPAAVADAIREMRVRGAPAIGIAGAYGLAIAALDSAAKADSPDHILPGDLVGSGTRARSRSSDRRQSFVGRERAAQ